MAENSNRKKQNKRAFSITISAILILIAIGLLFIIIRSIDRQSPWQEQEIQKEPEKVRLHTYQAVTQLVLTDGQGKQVHPLETAEDVTVLLFWASWCPHCKECIANVDWLKQTAEENGAKLWLVNKLDGEKETKEQAKLFLREQQIETENLFDEQCSVYEQLGLSMIPTLIVIDESGRILSKTEGDIPTQEQLAAMIQEAREGKAAVLESIIESTLLNETGGFRTNYVQESEEIPSGSDVLSESQGILLEYAALTGQQELFTKVWSYTETKLSADGLMPWVISDRTDTYVNALVDDLRIIGALQLMNKNTDGAWQEIYENYYNAVYLWNTADGFPVDFYDAKSGSKADRFTLCYGDLATLSQIKQEDSRYKKIYNETLKLVLGGQISEAFPLYYSYFDYSKQKYEGGTLNMAEELTTLLHLAEVGELPQPAVEWLEGEMDKGCIYASYDKDGSPAKDGYYESTAVYALVVMIALHEGREELAGQAVNRMEQLRIWEDGNHLNGLFGNSDGTGIYSFDQGMALLAYEMYERTAK